MLLHEFAKFARRAFVLSFRGRPLFYLWMAVLSVAVVVGGNAYMRQFVSGLETTGMTNHVPWGVYISNFTFLVGIAAAAVMLVIPAYIYRVREMRDVVILGELLSIAVIVMALLFVIVDLGQPLRSWHLMPGIGILNFPASLLAWDVVVLLGYLLLNIYICVYVLYRSYLGLRPTWLFYVPFMFLSIAWAISIHTATAFLYVGLVGRPFWNASIIAPRFLVSAFVSGPALIILTLQIIRRVTPFVISDHALKILRQIVTLCLLINMFILGSELFKELYSGALHNASTRYLFFGLEHQGHVYNKLVPWIWTAVGGQVIAALILTSPLRNNMLFVNFACLIAVLAVWIEKGMGLVIPGFIPTPLGDVVEYTPTTNETLICVGIWAFGALFYTWLLKIAIPILTGSFRRDAFVDEQAETRISAEATPLSTGAEQA